MSTNTEVMSNQEKLSSVEALRLIFTAHSKHGRKTFVYLQSDYVLVCSSYKRRLPSLYVHAGKDTYFKFAINVRNNNLPSESNYSGSPNEFNL